MLSRKLRFFLIVFLFVSALCYLYPKKIINPDIKKQSNFGFIPQSLLATPTPNPIVKIGLVGDLGLGRHITQLARSKNNFNWSFEAVSPYLKSNDFNLANLESPIIKNCPTGYKGTFTFCGDTRFLPILKDNKFIFNLANNHILNYQKDGLVQTQNYLSEYNTPFFYSHQNETEFLLKEFNGIKFGFLGFDLTGAHAVDRKNIPLLTKKYDQQVDWLIVSLHWGNEYLPQAEKWRIDLAHQLVDNGADIIHGHHPHVLQPEEVYQGKKIYYSLGNFIFDQDWSQETSTSQIVNLTLSKDSILEEKIIPLTIKYNSRPEPLE